MRPALALSLFGLSILCPGCALVEDSSHNFMAALCSPVENHREIARNRTWAENAWTNVCMSAPTKFSEDYAQGFKDGYAEFLYRGGDGEPPLLAPKYYRHLKYQTPQGYLAVEDWFAGYRYGAAVARDTGARRWITGPSGLPEPQIVKGPSKAPEPDPLPMPQPWRGGIRYEAFPPESVPADPPLFPSVKAEEAPVTAPLKAKITAVSVPPREPEAAIEPIRVRIRTVTPAAPKD